MPHKEKGLFNMTFKIKYQFCGDPTEEAFDESSAAQSIEDRINELEALGAVNIEETRICKNIEMFSAIAQIGDELLKDCPQNDCIIFRNVYGIFRAVEADYKRIIEAFPDLDESTELSITRKMNDCRKELAEMFTDNYAIQKYRKERDAARRTYREYIETKRKEWIGKKVMYEGAAYTVVDVDYNGALMIGKKARFTDTTAVSVSMVQIVE